MIVLAPPVPPCLHHLIAHPQLSSHLLSGYAELKFVCIYNNCLKGSEIQPPSVKYELTAYKQFFQLIRLCKPLIK